MMQRLCGFLAVLSLAACSSTEPSDGTVSVRMDRSSYRVPARATARLANGSPGTLYANVCQYNLERRVGTGWESLPSSIPCPAVLMPWATGEAYSQQVELPGSLAAGSYRIRFPVVYDGLENAESVRAVGPAFQVRASAE